LDQLVLDDMVIFQVGDADMMSSEVAVQSVELFIYLFIFGYSFPIRFC